LGTIHDKCRRILLGSKETERLQSIEKMSSERDMSSHRFDPTFEMTAHQTHLMQDVEMFDAIGSEPVIRPVLDELKTGGGAAFVKRILSDPVISADTLRERQALLRAVEARLPELRVQTATLGANEGHFAWLIEHVNDAEGRQVLDVAFWKTALLRRLNSSPWALRAVNLYRMILSPFLGILTPLIYVVVPFFVLRYKLGLAIPFGMFLRMFVRSIFSSSSVFDAMPSIFGQKVKWTYLLFTMLFYFQGVFNSIEIAIAVGRACSIVDERVRACSEYIRATEEALQVLDGGGIAAFFPEICAKTECSCFECVDRCTLPLIFRDFGKTLTALNSVVQGDDKVRAELLGIAHVGHAIDCVVAFAEVRVKMDMCYVEYGVANKGVSMVGVVHPSIPNPVANTVDLGANIVLTGPNAGGKSTLLKSILISAIFAQSTGTAFCRSMAMDRPYQHIASHINIPDCKGKESLFEAEMNRAFDLLKTAKSTAAGGRVLIVMDELLSSTNPVEGMSGAYAIASSLSQLAHVDALISTHFPFMARLERTTARLPKPFENHKMDVQLNANARFSYLYRLSRGVSKQYIAIELLAEKGFDPDIIRLATETKDFINRMASLASQKIKEAQQNQLP
jgi:energy-coupling factor transporter ATP-binding protein EcfA2